jgi:hypothetical protein
MFTSASRSSLARRRGSCPPPLLAPGSRSSAPPSPSARSSTATRSFSQRRGAAAARPPTPSPPSPQTNRGRGKPQWGWLAWSPIPHRPPLLLNPRRGVPRGKAPRCPWHAAAPGQVAPAAMRRPPRMLGGKGAAGSIPFPAVTRLGPRARAGLGVRASRAARPRATPRGLARLDRRRRAPGSADRRGQRDKGERKGKKRGSDERGPRGRG